jgi:hypothetical protein
LGPSLTNETAVSGVSWAAIAAGGTAAAALSLILLSLGIGLGFSAISPWAGSGVSATVAGISTIVWLLVTQILASGLGGYLAGRLRTKWAFLHTDEVYFRDTAHGFLAWAAATLVTAAFLANAVASALGVTASAAGSAAKTVAVVGASAAAMGADRETPDLIPYFSDALVRPAQPNATPLDAGSRSEVGRILVASIRSGTIDAADRAYLGQMIAAHAGITQPEAEKRIDDTLARAKAAAAKVEADAKQAADSARKGAAYTALWTFVALLTGAFSASLAATWGGRRRDSDLVVSRPTIA